MRGGIKIIEHYHGKSNFVDEAERHKLTLIKFVVPAGLYHKVPFNNVFDKAYILDYMRY